MAGSRALATQRFPLGVASFDPLVDRVLLWAATDRPGTECRWEIATDPELAHVVARGAAPADEASGTVTVDATGLAPGTVHWFRFTTADGAVSPVGRTRTLPGPGAGRLRVGVTCCARYGQSRFDAYRALAAHDVDVVAHLGDYVYEDTKADLEGRAPDPPHDCTTLDDYRARHAQARRDPDLLALHAAHPMVAVWDDHDLADNAWRGGAKTHDPDKHGPWADRLAAALRAHQDYLPKRLADPDDLTSAWRRLDAGDLLALVATEGRAHRDQPAGNPGTTAADHPDRTLLGAEQAAWLHRAVADPDVRWVFLLSGTVVSELVIDAPDALDGILPEKYAVVDGKATNTDQWDGYLAERRRLAAALAQRRGGNLVTSGDIHSSWAVEGPLGPAGTPVAVELVCPPAATTPLGQLLPTGAGDLLGPALADQLPGARWVDVRHRGYLTVEVTRDRAEAAWWRVDAGGEPGDATAELVRRWRVPWAAPMALVDPEPRPTGEADEGGGDAGPPPSPLSAARRSRRRRAAGVVAGAGSLALLAVLVRRACRR